MELRFREDVLLGERYEGIIGVLNELTGISCKGYTCAVVIVGVQK